MKKAAVTLLLVLLIALGFVGWMYISSEVHVISVQAQSVEAQAMQQRFEELREGIRRGAVAGTMLSAEDVGDADQYQFITYQVGVRNSTWVDAQALELQITPRDGDVLQCYAPDMVSIQAKGEGTVSAVLLTSSQSNAVRELTLTYYLWGIPFSLRTSYGGV